MKSSLGPILLESIGCLLVATGILIELVYEADVGFLTITGGSLAVAVGGLWYAKLRKGKLRIDGD